MVDAGEALNIERARETVEDLVASGHDQELIRWVEWKPAERPPEPLRQREQPAPAPVARVRDDGPEMGR